MQMRRVVRLGICAVIVAMVASCGFTLERARSATTTTSKTPAPRYPPTPDYQVDNCGVSGGAHSGQPSNVLLTIDDFPTGNPQLMIKLADWARSQGVMMEAFPVKAKIDEYQQATGIDLVAELRARGTYVSNHSYNHLELPKLTQEKVLAEIRGGVTSTYLRPPYGAFTPTIQQLAEAEGYRVCMWTLDTNDWRKQNGKYPSPQELVRRVRVGLQKIPAGTPVVILGHYYTDYPTALEAIAKEVVRMGNRICPAPDGAVTEEVPYPIC